jgi:hypothetical protein
LIQLNPTVNAKDGSTAETVELCAGKANRAAINCQVD